MKPGPLREMGATLTRTDYGDGVVLDTLLVEHCAYCASQRRDHAHVIPFRAGPHGMVPALGREVLVWQLVSGSTVDDITLSPSYLVASCGGLHGHVRDGRWVPC